MSMRLCAWPAALAAAAAAASFALAAEIEKKPLDHGAYERWRFIQDDSISSDGEWVMYSLSPDGPGDATLKIHDLRGRRERTVERGEDGVFTRDARHAAFLIKPPYEEVRQAKIDKAKPADMPKDALGVMDLASGEITEIERVKSFKLPEEAGGWVAVLLHEPPKEDEEEEAPDEEGEAEQEKPEPEQETEPEPEKKTEQEPEQEEEGADEEEEDEKKKDPGTELILLDLAGGEQRSFEHVVEYAFDENANYLAFATSTEDGESDGVFILDLESGVEPIAIAAGEGRYKSLAFDKAGEKLAFLSDAATYQEEQPEYALHLWRAGDEDAAAIASAETDGVPDGWWVSERQAPEFSESGARLMFGTAPRPEPETEDEEEEMPDDERVRVDVWHWQDDYLQPRQLLQKEQEEKRSYLAVAHLDDETPRIVQLADEDLPTIEIGTEGDADIAVGATDLPYRRMIQWDIQVYNDVYLIDVETGERELVLEQERGGGFGQAFQLSPDSKYVAWWDWENSAFMAMDVASREIANLTDDMPYPVDDQLHDTPSLPGPYGVAGWLEDDAAVLVYDRHDVWMLDPADVWNPTCVTEETGRENDRRFRVIDLDPDEEAIDPSEPLLLSAFHLKNKDAGFYRDRVRGGSEPQRLMLGPKRFSTPDKAEDADVLLLERESFHEFPDLWVTDMDFDDWRRVSNANPQQSEYLWGDVELVEWTSTDGEALQGMLYTPPGFDPDKQYPLIAYFYERNSDNLHNYSPPTPHRSIIRFSFYASRGYLIFVPDIPYEIGHPGASAVRAVTSGVTHLVNQGFVDPDRIGMQGHSWGGYQVAHIATQTDMFAAAISGAPVANMTSAYGGVRWGSGLSRQFQYEQTQSRIGGTLWEKPLLYIENSPLFHLDRVSTPMLILHNDKDGAVPWYQGIELFVGLRRLDKPAWMLNYNDEPHWPVKYQNRRDYAERMQQFFDHYLKDAPPPVWLEEGVPAVEKGETLGLELVEEEADSGE